MFDFYMPVRVLAGENVLIRHADALAALGSRCLLVTGRHSAKASGVLDELTALLQQREIAYDLFDGIEPNPTVESCILAAEQARGFQADFVIGIGGGSPLDAAKVVALLATNPLTVEQLYAQQWTQPPLPTVCIGTTAGTGSEVTRVSVLTADGKKRSITADLLYPALSFADPRYTASCSYRTTVTCALDALSHALEGYFSSRATEISDSMAIGAVQTLCDALQALQTLPDAKQGGAAIPMEIRSALYSGAMQAGMTLNLCGAGFPHTMGYILTEEYDLPHGFACAAFLSAYLERAFACLPEKAAKLGVSLDRLLNLLQTLGERPDAKMTPEQIEGYRARFVGNKNFANSPGKPDDAFGAALLQTLFG